MNAKLKNFMLVATAILAVAISADGQVRRGRGRNQNNNNAAQPPVDTTQKPQVVTNNNQAPVNYNPYGNTPIRMAPLTGGGFNDTIRKSMVMDGAYEKGISQRIPLDYEFIRSDDALFTERVWREIDIREKMNQVFRYKTEGNNGDQRFINILVRAIRDSMKAGRALAYSPDDDRFTTPLNAEQFEKVLKGGVTACDTLPVYNINDPTKIDSFVVSCPTLDPDEIMKFRIKEDWVFDRESSRMFCRIIGIAPLKTILGTDKKTEKGAQPLFWVYYPDMRSSLVKYEVYNPKNMGQSRMTWEELFESRMFSSYIIKSTFDNPKNQLIKNYIKDPILALLEGDNIKEKIFNYEQDLWSY